MAYVKAISYYLPQQSLTNSLIAEQFPEWTIEKISSKTGIYARPTSGKDEYSSDMALSASEKLFSEYQIDKAEIDFILLCTQSPDYFLPTTACILQHKLGLRTETGALDFNLGCSGYVYGLALAKGLIDTGMAKNVLLVTSETYTKFIHPKDKSNLTIFGDAAAATLVSKEGDGGEIKNFVFGTDGAGADNLIVKRGGVRFPHSEEAKDIVDEFGNITNEKNLYMNGSAIFNFTIDRIPKLIKEVLAVNQSNEEGIDLYVFHQANLYMLNHLRKKLGVPEDKFFVYLKDCGNTVSSTIPIALCEALRQQKIIMGNNVLLAGFGVGYSWAGCVLQF